MYDQTILSLQTQKETIPLEVGDPMIERVAHKWPWDTRTDKALTEVYRYGCEPDAEINLKTPGRLIPDVLQTRSRRIPMFWINVPQIVSHLLLLLLPPTIDDFPSLSNQYSPMLPCYRQEM
jgi:hypothetical protein